jgi:hypothetical protein
MYCASYGQLRFGIATLVGLHALAYSVARCTYRSCVSHPTTLGRPPDKTDPTRSRVVMPVSWTPEMSHLGFSL